MRGNVFSTESAAIAAQRGEVAVRKAGGVARAATATHTQLYPHPSSIDRAPSSYYPIALKFSKDIEQQPDDGSLANQGAAAP